MNVKRTIIAVAGLLLSSTYSWAQYSTPETIQVAIGPVESLSPEMRRAFTENGYFSPLPKPGAGDWLAINSEPGQTYRQFVRSNPNKPSSARNVIYIQPLDDFAGQGTGALATIRTFSEAFFQLPVTLQKSIDIAQHGITERKNPGTKQRQLLTTDILDYLRGDMPGDSYCRLGITTIDLYPEASWNYVFGQASLSEGTGVYSFARYEPAFYGKKPKRGDDTLALLRSFKVFAHETGHMFGIQHCIYLLCVMNGSNNMEEADLSPLHLCPVCLRKLQHSIAFDIVERYRALEVLYDRVGLTDESDWVKKRATYVATP